MLVPDRISPPAASGAPESRLPVCELWMFPLVASSLYSPRMNSVFSRKSSSGWSTLPSFRPFPSPLADHSVLWKPLPPKSTASRTGGSLARDAPPGASPQTGSDSSQGSAIVTPRPRSTERRERR